MSASIIESIENQNYDGMSICELMYLRLLTTQNRQTENRRQTYLTGS